MAVTNQGFYTEKSAVAVSFWIGGSLLVILKGFAYLASGSSLVRASMFESMGDVISSTIMAVTEKKVANTRDIHNYPVGKRRLTPLGVLFFSAFAISAMTSMAIEAVQGLVVAAGGPGVARQLFDENPRFRRGLHVQEVEEIIRHYDDADNGSENSDEMTMKLYTICIFVKMFCLAWCTSITRRTGSEISKTLSRDHKNDILSNALVLFITAANSGIVAKGITGEWVEKIEPAATLLLALWIIYGWLDVARDQMQVLSDCIADPPVVEAVTEAARKQLEHQKSGLVLRSAEAHHIGDGLEARLELAASSGHSVPLDQLVASLESLNGAVQNAESDVKVVQVKLVKMGNGDRV